MAKYKTPKYPRVIVSKRMHQRLHQEAVKKGMSLTQLVELKLKN